MPPLPALNPALSARQKLVRLLAIAGVCSLAVALPRAMPSQQTAAFGPLTPALETLADLPTLRLPVSLPTGTELSPPVGRGHSQLTVKNGNSVDAVFKLVDISSGQTLRFMYVRANDHLTVDHLGTCTCDLRFATGIDWDAEQRRFRRAMAISVFSDPAEFVVQREGNMEYWTTLEVTLHPVVGGNAQTESLDESAF